jgi:hypothetical protein
MRQWKSRDLAMCVKKGARIKMRLLVIAANMVTVA